MNEHRLIGYKKGEGFIYELSGTSKLLFFLIVSISAMISYDTRVIAVIGLLSLSLFKFSHIKLKDISFVLIFASAFAIMNAFMVYLFSPEYGTEIYGSKTILFSMISRYNVTAEELFYILNLLIKYCCTVPLAIVFLMTTSPSQFASGLNKIGVSYKIAYSVSLTMRYIPDIQEEFLIVRQSMEARGLELSKKAKFMERVKGNLSLIIPLIFSSLDKIEIVSTAMELRRFGKNKKRTWYSYQAMKAGDVMVILLALTFLGLVIFMFHANGGRFYNPFTG